MLGRNGDHLNAYLLSNIIKRELQNAEDEALQAQLGKKVRQPVSKTRQVLKKTKKAAMTDLRDHNTNLRTYMIHMGSLSEKYDKRSKEVIQTTFECTQKM